MAGGLGGLIGALGRPSAGDSGSGAPASSPSAGIEDTPVDTAGGAVSDGELAAATELRAAMDAGSDEEFATALKRFVRMAREG